MDDPQDFQTLQDQIQASLVSTTKTANRIASEDLSFQRSLDPSIGASLDEQSARLLAVASSLLESAASISGLKTPLLEDVEDVDSNWHVVVDVVDSLLEKADTCLDEYTGVIKNKSPPAMEQSSKSKKHQSLGSSFKNQNLVKPQLAFENKADNTNIAPWKPLLQTKPHATISLVQSLGTFTNELGHQQYDYTVFLPFLLLRPDAQSPEGLKKSQRYSLNKKEKRLKAMGRTRSSANDRFRYKHPYETEILELQYPDAVYHKADPIPYLPVESTSATFIDTFEGVLSMLAELKNAKEIAVDLEHHETRSYIGLVSLMQISTREKDWIVDTLKPWREDIEVLNEVFTDPKIIKVFHGAYMDIVWLQRDLGLYVTGLFDTHHASRVLGYPGGSLAYLLKRFIDFDANKKYQLADWRIRPLPDEMFFYARADTHYLLYIYDNLRNELVERSNSNIPDENKIEIVLQRSKETSLLRFERQIYNDKNGKGPGGWYQLLVKTPGIFTNEQFAVFRAAHAWRDHIARIDDESTNYVLKNHVLFSLAEMMPMDIVSLHGVIHPTSHNVKSRAAELLALIQSAKENGKDGPSMMDVLRHDSVATEAKINMKKMAAMTKSEEALTASPPLIDQGQLRSDESMFWGNAFGSSIWEPSAASASNSTDLRLAVPLPQVPIGVSADSTGGLTDRSRLLVNQNSSIKLENKAVNQSSHRDEAFIIKSGHKRKAQEMEVDLSETKKLLGENGASLDDHEKEEIARKKALKAERRARKRAKRAAARKLAAQINNVGGDGGTAEEDLEEEQEEEEEEGEEEPFDYAKADSVLHGKGKEADSSGAKGRKPLDPYAKSADAPKGMRKVRTERVGKSFTFKS